MAIELERVFEDLLPLLRTVQPEKLSATLNALARPSRAAAPGWARTSSWSTPTSSRSTPSCPVIKADISGLADLAQHVCRGGTGSGARGQGADHHRRRRSCEKKDALAGFLAGTAGFANTTADFLDANGQRIIRVGAVQRPTVEVLARYSPQYPCIATAMTNWIPRIDEAWRDKTFHITLEVTQQRPGYKPGEEPRWGENRGPSCQGLPGKVRHPGEPLDRQPLRRRHQPLGLGGRQRPAVDVLRHVRAEHRRRRLRAGRHRAGAGRRGGPAVPDGHTARRSPRSSPGPMLRGTVVNQR